VLKAAEKSPLYAYIVLSLLTGVRTEEARALCWDHVELDRPRHRRVPTMRAVVRKRPELIVRLG
jgi:integrase